jgi:molybdate transport system substrate-binding protein
MIPKHETHARAIREKKENFVKTKATRVRFVGVALATVLIAFIFLSIQNSSAQVSELAVLSSDGMQPAVRELTPQIERSIGRKMKTQYDSSNNLVAKIKGGDAFDVAILTTNTLDDMIKQGKISADSRTDLARCGVGIGIRAGAPKPDITTPEALKRTLLKAKLVTFNSTGATAGLVNKLFERLAIVDAMKPKIISSPVSGGAQKQVAEGKADLVLILIPEVTQEAGVEYLGPLPGDLQSYINFTGGVSANSHDPEKAKALLRYIASADAAATIKAKGLEPR